MRKYLTNLKPLPVYTLELQTITDRTAAILAKRKRGSSEVEGPNSVRSMINTISADFHIDENVRQNAIMLSHRQGSRRFSNNEKGIRGDATLQAFSKVRILLPRVILHGYNMQDPLRVALPL